LVEEEDVEVLLALEEALVALDPASVAVVAKVRAKSRVESDRIIVLSLGSNVTGNLAKSKYICKPATNEQKETRLSH
jgi:hypothetical protein